MSFFASEVKCLSNNLQRLAPPQLTTLLHQAIKYLHHSVTVSHRYENIQCSYNA